MRSNYDDRCDVIRDLGAEEFYGNEAYSGLWDIEPPVCFSYIYRVFIELYNGSKEKVTWRDIAAYCEVRKTLLSQYEVDLVRKMSVWADEAVDELKKEEG